MTKGRKPSRKTGWNQDRKNTAFARMANARKRRREAKKVKSREKAAEQKARRDRFIDTIECPSCGDVDNFIRVARPRKGEPDNPGNYCCPKCAQRLRYKRDKDDNVHDRDEEVPEV